MQKYHGTMLSVLVYVLFVETLDLSPNRQMRPSLTLGAPSINFRLYGIQISSFFKHFLSQCLVSVGAGSANYGRTKYFAP